MAAFRKKPVVIEAFRFNPALGTCGAYASQAPTWFLDAEVTGKAKIWSDDEEPYCMIQTLEGKMKAIPGDWIIKGIKGELYPCKPDIFAATYDVVD